MRAQEEREILPLGSLPSKGGVRSTDQIPQANVKLTDKGEAERQLADVNWSEEIRRGSQVKEYWK